MLRTPRFWAAGSTSIWPVMLGPLAALYSLGNRLHRAASTPRDGGLPVISVGNLVAGGAGKTPAALALAARLGKVGQRPHFVSRGYGGRLSGPVQVDPARHTAGDTGDEPLLLARAAPTWIGRDRAAAARAAAAAGASCVIADDAHQTYRLKRAISLLVIDADYGFGNGRLLPAGPLREPVAEGLKRTHAVILIGDGTAPPPDFGDLPVFRARLEANAEDAARLQGSRVFAFAGIARPEKFFASLRDIGADVVEAHPFPDHAVYDEDTIMRLVEAAQTLQAVPVTTEKDLVRFPVEARPMVQTLRVDLRFDDEAAVDAFLQKRLTRV